nr:unnamed protein product [Digitaria exilis]
MRRNGEKHAPGRARCGGGGTVTADAVTPAALYLASWHAVAEGGRPPACPVAVTGGEEEKGGGVVCAALV